MHHTLYNTVHIYIRDDVVLYDVTHYMYNVLYHTLYDNVHT